MSTVVPADQFIFEFSADNEPVTTVENGSTVVFETQDCFCNQLRTEEDTIDELNWSHVNPATGPVFVEGAKPGDTLKVEILEIAIEDQAVVAAGEGAGTLGDILEGGLSRKYMPIKDGKLKFDDKLSLGLNKMIGVIGVAPEPGKSVNCGTPDTHGGNMDNTMIAEGSTLYFPVRADGALFALGDLHAAMGDGEIGVSGAEIAGKVTVRLTVLDGCEVSEHPALLNDDSFALIVSAETLDEAADIAIHDMARILEKETPLEMVEVAMLLSLAADIEIAQVVDPLKTVRYVLPRKVLDAYNFDWNRL